MAFQEALNIEIQNLPTEARLPIARQQSSGFAALRRIVAASCAVLASSTVPAYADNGPAHGIYNASTVDSSNWAGYQVPAPEDFDYVTGDWIVPSVTCPSSGDAGTSIWVGAGSGASTSDELYQTGIVIRCDDGSEAITPFWEEYPENTTQSFEYSHTVNTGDKIVAQVIPNGSNGVTMSVYDYSSLTAPYFSWIDSESTYSSDPDASQAECIVERPTDAVTNTYLSLPDFDSVTFSTATSASFAKGCDVTADNNDHQISSTSPGLSGVDRLDMQNSSHSYLAETSNPSTSGGFTVYWDASS